MKDCSDIVAIIDRSGSMAAMKEEAIGAFNAFIERQRQVPGEAVMTLVLFDNEYLKLYEAQSLDLVPVLDEATFVPRGSTALLDAIGRSIDETGERLAALSESQRPNQVIVCILTDGKENASQHYKQADVASRIKHQSEVYSWEFVFLAANQDAFATGGQLNIKAEATFQFAASPQGIQAGLDNMDKAVTRLRSAPSKQKA